MRAIMLFFFILVTVATEGQTGITVPPPRSAVFRNVTLVPMDRETVIPGQDVWIRDGRVERISPTGKLSTKGYDLVIDGTGKFLMPGLAEMHAHVPPIDDIEPMKEVLMLFAVNGVTTIRGMLGHPRHLELRAKIRSGDIPGPRFISSGPSLSGNSVKTPEDGIRIVEEEKKAGYDFLKLHPGLTPATFDPIVKRAKELDIPFAGHVSYTVGVERAIEAGYATIDHMDGFVEWLVPGIAEIPEREAGSFGMFIGHKADLSRLPLLAKSLAEKKIWVVPTQCLFEKWFSNGDPAAFDQRPEMIYMSGETRKNWINSKRNIQKNPLFDSAHIEQFTRLRRTMLKSLHDAGVPILLGSDAPQVFDVPGFSLHDELAYYVLAGLTPYQALRTGTIHAGEFLGDKNIGRITEKSYADLVLLSANPLQSIDATRKIEGVMLNGRWMDAAFIRDALRKLEKQ
jgi:imidazolonepropionase-like amidohydrolase